MLMTKGRREKERKPHGKNEAVYVWFVGVFL
jgi:hypothetical protein